MMSDPDFERPGSVPENETIIPPDVAFIEECKADLAEDLKVIGGQLGKSILTHSDKWGMIWRVDVCTRSSSLMRVTMWRAPGETTGFGRSFNSQQPIVPLE